MAADPKPVGRWFFEDAWNSRDLTLIDELIAPTYTAHDPSAPDFGRGPERIKKMITLFRTAFPDLHVTVEDVVVQGDKEVVRWIGRGTHKGELMGIAPTGKPVTITGIDIARIAGGKIEEIWNNWDALGLLQQIGGVPPLGQAKQ
jgi:ketosteroid isomerase-like protein